MAEENKWLRALGGAGKVLENITAGMQTYNAAQKIANDNPEIKAVFIAGNMNTGNKLGIKFKSEGTSAIGEMTPDQAKNLASIVPQLTEAEYTKFIGNINLIPDLKERRIVGDSIKSRNHPEPDAPDRFIIDAKEIKDWDSFSRGLDFFGGKNGSAPAIKAAIITGDVEEVRKALAQGTAYKLPEQAVSTPTPAASEPEQAPPGKKKRGFGDVFEKLNENLPKGGSTPNTDPAQPQSSLEKPLDVAALAAELGLKAPTGQQVSSSPTFGGAARERSDDRGVA